MNSESVLPYKDTSRFRRHASRIGKGIRHPKYDQKGDNRSEKITYCALQQM